MSDSFGEHLQSDLDAVLDELQNAADVDAGLADLRARLGEQQVTNLQDRRSERQSHRINHASTRDRFLTAAEVASIIRVSKMTVYRLIHTGELPAIRVGRSFRIPEHEISVYMGELYEQHQQDRYRK